MQETPVQFLGQEDPLEKEGISYPLQYSWASLVAQTVKNLPAMRETWVPSWVGKIPWRRARQLTPVFLPGESPWTEEPGGLQPMGSQRVRHNRKTKHNVLRCSLEWVGEDCGLSSSIIWLCNDDFSFQFRFPQRLQRVHSWVSCLNPQSMRIPSWSSSQTWTWLLQNG